MEFVVEMFSAPPPISEKQEYGKMEIVVERNSRIFGSKRGWGFSKSKVEPIWWRDLRSLLK
ncbi:hypothetical protein RchiOBHm_Chr6g0265381 [Rosa chinensis]|uniref:Uncharacterized protein n=1 Tax=Rosa chinensis TaxID=74649 RepID=A0A2P6PPF5_ROSCH|nr:hypothetical protein RchiOBHm_Chr6g0265381 [Rosa chinensis]